MRRLLTFLRRDRCGASAAEFALILPLALLILFTLIDVGRYVWVINQAEKAAQAGARYAVATRIIPSALDTWDWVGTTACGPALKAGDRICKEALGTIKCTASGCTCAKAPCPAIGTPRTAAFSAIVARMRTYMPDLPGNTVTVSYSGSGIGFAGDPSLSATGQPLSDIAPLVTVGIRDVPFDSFSLFGVVMPRKLPPVSASLTLEDGDGTRAF